MWIPVTEEPATGIKAGKMNIQTHPIVTTEKKIWLRLLAVYCTYKTQANYKKIGASFTQTHGAI